MEKLKVFLHQLYECRKGVRPIALCTLPKCCMDAACKKLEREGFSYLIRSISQDKFNLFFGDEKCLEVLRLFGDKPLNKFTDEEDFILGTMLGYSVGEQCSRYCTKHKKLQPSF